MHLLCLGINHSTAPLHIREKMVFSEDLSRLAMAHLGCCLHSASEMVILSTCNRIELYVVSSTPGFDELESVLSDLHGISIQEFRAHLYRFTDDQLVDHLFRVTAGLDSLVLGEPQILGQVARAHELALDVGACGPTLSRLFRSAIHAGKRVRTETGISRNPASVPSLAASFAAQQVNDLSDAQVVVVGAGQMAELAVEALRKRGAEQITVVNRSMERAKTIASRWQAKATSFEYLDELLLRADIVISSTSAPYTIINIARMDKIMAERLHRPIVMMDIAVPRDIDQDVSHIPGVRLFDMDSLEDQVQNHLAERAAEVPRVEEILREESSLFLGYLQTLDMLPIISELRKQAESIRQNELERTLRRLPGLSEEERARIDAMTRSLVKKLMATPTQRLRAEANCPHASEYATVARTLFDLSDDTNSCSFSGERCSLIQPISSARQHPPAHSDQCGD